MPQLFLSFFLMLTAGAVGVSGYFMADRLHVFSRPIPAEAVASGPDGAVLAVPGTIPEPAPEVLSAETGAPDTAPAEPASDATGDTEPGQAVPVPADPDRCDPRDPLPLAGKSTLPELRRLAALQDLCRSLAADSLMVFTGMPGSSDATDIAQGLAGTLKAYRAARVSPIVILEPVDGQGPVRLTDIARGTRDQALDRFFQELRRAGVTDDMIGTWAPYPEINTPTWDARDWKPGQFPGMVTRFFGIMRKHFPGVQGSVLLEARSYASDDTEWNHGSSASFAPYLSGIPAGTLQSFGLQGFPWQPPAGDAAKLGSDTQAGRFLPTVFAIEAARILHIDTVWINTGTFGSKYSGKQRVTVGTATRARILDDILTQAATLRGADLSVSINIFAEDKSGAEEATDWSYGDLAAAGNPDRTALRDFIRKARADGAGISLFIP